MSEGLPAGELETERRLIINEVAGMESGSSTAPTSGISQVRAERMDRVKDSEIP
jgi:hypothetical protein